MKEYISELQNISCPVERTVSLVGNKWSLMILKQLYYNGGPLRFNQLLKTLKPVSSKTLSAKLKDLEKFEIVSKEIIPARPPMVQYQLTEKGMEFAEVFATMAKWSKKWHGD
ncbi:MAG: HxlR-like helix-turn-helix [Methanomassiliicoccales archaeon PtaU1.Bin124]|nr:MAG: HxlR-like helix-turn-helix [Methanomassiliicoccales archaeon PtaU1.Bin124]